MATLGLSVGQGETEPERKRSDRAGKLLKVGNGRCVVPSSRQHHSMRYGEDIVTAPGRRTWRGLCEQFRTEQLRSLHLLKGYENQTKETR